MYYTIVPLVLQYYKHDGTPMYIYGGGAPSLYIHPGGGSPFLYIHPGGVPPFYIYGGGPSLYIHPGGGPLSIYTWGHPPHLGWINVLHHRTPSTPVLQA